MISYTDAKGAPRRKKTSKNSLLIHAAIRDIEPQIWRRILVSESMELGRFHDVLQVAFNWYDYQLHRFTVGGVFYGNPYFREGAPTRVDDDRDVLLTDLQLNANDVFTYEYFMGEGWFLDLKIEKIEPLPTGFKYPYCVAGERGGPPEDCGGVEGFKEILYSLAHPEEPISQEWIEWIGEYDPAEFDVLETNKLIAKLMR